MDNAKMNTTAQTGNCGSRLNGKAAVQDVIDRWRRKADQYEALLKEMPEELSPAADEALWEVAMNARV